MFQASGVGPADPDPSLAGAWAFDLQAYLAAASRLAHQGSVYAEELLESPFEPGAFGLYYYPPPLAVAMLPLEGLPIADVALAWWAIHVVALLVACALMPVSLLIRAFAFAVVAFSVPGLKDPVLGNISLVLLPFLTAAWRWLDRPVGSLAIAAAASIRPSLGVFLFWQMLRRRWRAAAWTIVGGLTLAALSLPFVGLDGHWEFMTVISNIRLPAGPSENEDLGAAFIEIGAEELAGPARLASILIACAAIVYSLRRDRETSFMVTLCASLLLVPLLWVDYLATLALPAAFLAQRVHPVLVLLPLMTWLPLSQAIVVAVVMVLPLLARDGASRLPVQPMARPPVHPSAA
jgi:hypothetical protein